MGLSLSTVFLIYTQASIALVFFITAAAVRRAQPLRLHHLAQPVGDGLVPGDGPVRPDHRQRRQPVPAEQRPCSSRCRSIGVGIFAGLTAWDTQAIKDSYFAGDGYEASEKKAIFGALRLYLDFINLFQQLLFLMGNRRS